MIDLFSPGAYCRVPGGNLERPDIQAPVVKWMAWNIGGDVNYDPTVWDRCRMLWNQAGIQNFPWLHCHTMADIDKLIGVAKQYGSPAIGLNIEDVVTDKFDLSVVGQHVQSIWGQPVHMAVLPWLPNGQGWQNMAFAVGALEIFKNPYIFPTEPDPVIVDQCISHAKSEGLTQITLMMDTKQFTPGQYGRQFSVCHSLYTADDITPDASSWNAWLQQQPCTKIQGGGTSVLTPNQKKSFRAEIAAYTKLAEQYESRWHYSQNRPYRGLGAAPQTYHVDDCSSYCALAFYWAAHHTGVHVADPLNFNYTGYGNTQSAFEYLKAHKAPRDKYRIGDMAIYGPASDTVHMMLCRKAGTGTTALWSSFGQEAGPEVRDNVHYHPSPLLGIYRHPALL